MIFVFFEALITIFDKYVITSFYYRRLTKRPQP
jgi:hypothetical protein